MVQWEFTVCIFFLPIHVAYNSVSSFSRDQALVEVVTKQLGNFRTAIKLSLNIAEDGCTLAKDVLFTCEKITNFFESSVEMQNDRSHVQAQVNDMLQLAKDAEARSIEAIDLFRTIRRELWPVVNLWS